MVNHIPYKSTAPSLSAALSDNDVSVLHDILEAQDLELFNLTAKTGTPEIAQYLLSRYTPSEDHSQRVMTPKPSTNPVQYLVRASARNGNAVLFRDLVNRYPVLFDGENRNVPDAIFDTILGGVPIWEVLLERSRLWIDYEFPGHHGYALERVLEYGSKELLELFLQNDPEVYWLQDMSLSYFVTKYCGADQGKLEVIAKYYDGTKKL